MAPLALVAEVVAVNNYRTAAEIVTQQPGYTPTPGHVVYQTAGVALLLAIGAGLIVLALAQALRWLDSLSRWIAEGLCHPRTAAA